jgi:hypothetical protein
VSVTGVALVLWTALAAVLIIVAYAVPIAHHLALHRHGLPGFKPY